ncbi:LuxR family transcriptional regulator [Actinomadura sp. DC4]|uniref:helix-turn-helix transcriptional regulator n=1 Tax=Actinomadura sp. DC4 TaxID=3055069 RepID=UPI0025B15AC1|nr:LuxR family transcriptional regulator [Actinomadura sp. DC4]MDN3357534.1 LuxR C-terminal-related transcriptional regulator [Actinomadura sp. DC4]
MRPYPDVTTAGVPSWPGWRGRPGEWSTVVCLLGAAEGGRGGVLLIEGAEGMGKTRLLRRAADLAEHAGLGVIQGEADELGQLTPLAPLTSALGESAGTLLADRSGRPEIVDLRSLLIDAVRVRLEDRLGAGPLLVTLDDLQWADPTTCLALRSLIPDLVSYPLVWMLARTGRDSARDRLFDTLERDGATRITLEELDEGAVAEIAADVLGAGAAPGVLAVASAARGNPFRLVELLQEIDSEGLVKIVDGWARLDIARLPQVRAIARRRLEHLSSPAQRLLQVAAVLGRAFPVDDLAEMLGELPSRLLPQLKEASAAGIIVSAGDTLVFRHELLRRAVAETLDTPVRLALHRQAGEMLLNRGGSAVPAATHLMHSARSDSPATLIALDRAADEVLRSAPQTAADLAVRALELTAPTAPGRHARMAAAVEALTSAGRLGEAAELARSALGHAPPGEAGRLHGALAAMLLLSGRPTEAVKEATCVLAGPDLTGEARGVVELAWFEGLIAMYDFGAGRRRAEEIVAAPGEHCDASVVGALMLLMCVAWSEGRIADGLAHIRRAVRIAGHGPVGAPHRTPPRLLLAGCLTAVRELEEAETLIQAVEDEVEAFGHTTHAARPSLTRARVRLAAGALDDAAAEAEAGLAIADEFGGCNYYMLWGLTALIVVALRHGDMELAARYARRHQAERKDFDVMWGAWSVALVGEAEGDLEQAGETLGYGYGDPGVRCWVLATEPILAAWMTRIALADGRRTRAERVVETAELLAVNNREFPVLAAAAAHARGLLGRDAASLAEAEAGFADPWAAASAAEDLGVLVAETDDDRQAAVEILDRALDGYRRIGARRDAARVRARLRALGVRRRHWSTTQRPATGWAALTATEQKVALLVAQGLTNRQVATRMFISPHTIKFHLSKIFAKLHIASRTELAHLVAERSVLAREN